MSATGSTYGPHPILSIAYQLWPFLTRNKDFCHAASKVLRTDQLPKPLLAASHVPVHHLDWGGGAPVSAECSAVMAERICDPTPLLNPHTGFGESPRIVQDMRRRVLEFFGATQDTHILVWTSGATQSMQLVGEHFPLAEASALVYSLESHTSAVGLRNMASGSVGVASIENPLEIEWFRGGHPAGHSVSSLYVLAGECNLSGAQLADLPATVRQLKQAGHTVLLDAAKLACTPGGLDLSKVDADFVAISLYKVFGAPTGLGALIVRADSLPKLSASFGSGGGGYFGGGSVDAVSAKSDFCIRSANIVKALERGSINWMAITQQLSAALASYPSKTCWPFLSQHVKALTELLCRDLKGLHHCNGIPLCRIIAGNHDGQASRQGPTLAAVYQWSDGSPIPFDLVESLAHARGLLVRAGCCCNTGACQRWLQLSDADIRRNYECGRVCGGRDDPAPSGFVRVSLGYMSTISDVFAWIAFLREAFLNRRPSYVEPTKALESESVCSTGVPESFVDAARVSAISVYPLKGAAALVDGATGESPSQWLLSTRRGGLVFDRQFLPYGPDGRAIYSKSSKYGHKLKSITPVLEASRGCLWLRSDAEPRALLAPLTTMCLWESGPELLAILEDSECQKLDLEASQRLSLAEFAERLLGPGCTIRSADGVGSKDVLMVSKSTLDAVAQRTTTEMNPAIFRANLVIEGTSAEQEYDWAHCLVSCAEVEVPLLIQRHCVRCMAVGRPALTALASTTRNQKGPVMGVIVKAVGGGPPEVVEISVGDAVLVAALRLPSSEPPHREAIGLLDDCVRLLSYDPYDQERNLADIRGSVHPELPGPGPGMAMRSAREMKVRMMAGNDTVDNARSSISYDANRLPTSDNLNMGDVIDFRNDPKKPWFDPARELGRRAGSMDPPLTAREKKQQDLFSSRIFSHGRQGSALEHDSHTIEVPSMQTRALSMLAKRVSYSPSDVYLCLSSLWSPRHRPSPPAERSEDMFGHWALGWEEGYWHELRPYLHRLSREEDMRQHYPSAFLRLKEDRRIGEIVTDLQMRYERSGAVDLLKAICSQLDAPCRLPSVAVGDPSILSRSEMDDETLDEALAVEAEDRQWKSLVLAATIGLYQVLLTTACPKEGDDRRTSGEFYMHGEYLLDRCRSRYPSLDRHQLEFTGATSP
ncbi:hypothetical protein FOZ62_023160 [Perkinsus olseni]|uniref:MOSC domain-containing protein n=1 Tax=Perkinsus olseni TaxID=32597 RepID=A0A7J6R5Y6_PEROL|nr:hypothetical protein FOZ62_023160 [Perkinsus olseni]